MNIIYKNLRKYERIYPIKNLIIFKLNNLHVDIYTSKYTTMNYTKMAKIAKKATNHIYQFKNKFSILHSLIILSDIMETPGDFKPVIGVEKEFQKLLANDQSMEEAKYVVAEMCSQNEKLEKEKNAKLGGKAVNGKMEDLRLDFLVNTPTHHDRILLKAGEIRNKKAISIRKLGGLGPADLICIMEDGEEVGIEVKGFIGKREVDEARPWHNTTPQTANIHKEYNFDTTFVNYWYEHVLPVFKREFKITQDIPEKSVWIKEDMLKIGSCKTEFSKELKQLYKTNQDVKKRISEMADTAIKLTTDKMTEEDKRNFGEITKNKLNTKLSGKPLWLNVSYESISSVIPSEETFSLVETPKITGLEVIGHKKMRKSHIIKFKYTTSKSNGTYYEGEARPRFRNTTGIANFGWNIKPY